MRTSTEGQPYQTISKPTETKGGNPSKKFDPVSGIGDVIDKLHIKKLTLVLLLIGYGVIAFSKGEEGVSEDDLAHYVLFVVFLLAAYSSLHFFEKRYGDNESIDLK